MATQRATWTLRDYTPADYPGLAAVHNACYPEYPETADDFDRTDLTREPKVRWGRYVAEAAGTGEVVGWARWANSSHAFHPRKFWLDVAVLPAWRGRGIGAALYARLLEAVKPLEPIVLRAELREDNATGWGFAQRRGYRVEYREQESRLDIAAFAPERFAAELERVRAAGIRLETYAALSALPDAAWRLHVLDDALSRDVPGSDPPTDSSFETWSQRILENPRFLPGLNLIAVDGEGDDAPWVGLSNLWKDELEGRVTTGLTGVLRSHRKRGIATALKVTVLAAAKAAGHGETITWNAESNRGMLGINGRLGFVKTPAWMMIENVLDAAALAAASGKEAP